MWKWQDKCGGGFVIIGRAGGLTVAGPGEKVASTGEQIHLPGGEEDLWASGGRLFGGVNEAPE